VSNRLVLPVPRKINRCSVARRLLRDCLSASRVCLVSVRSISQDMPLADTSVFHVESRFDHGKHRNAFGGTEMAEKRGFTHLSRKSPHSKYQYMEDGRMSARCPKGSFELLSVSRECGLLCIPWFENLSLVIAHW